VHANTIRLALYTCNFNYSCTVLSVCEDWVNDPARPVWLAKKKCRNKFFCMSKKKNIFINLFTDIRITNKKYIYFFFSNEFLPMPELKLFVVEFLPTPELKLFAVEFLIGIIRVRIFTNARVGIIRSEIFTNARVGSIRDRIFTGARVRNIINKSL